MRLSTTLATSILLLAVLAACGAPAPTDTPAPDVAPEADATLAPVADVPAEPPSAEEESAPDNLAAAENGGRVVSASDELDCCPAANLIDGYKLDGGEWWTDEPPSFPQTVVVELAGGRVWAVDRVVLNPWTSEWRYAWVKDFEIYASADSPNPDDMGYVGAFTLEHAGVDQTFTFDAVQARYLALVVTSHYGSAEGVTLNELEVYAAPEGVAGEEPPAPGGALDLAAAAAGPMPARSAAALPAGAAAGVPFSLPALTPPAPGARPADFGDKKMAAGSGAADNIDYDIEQRDLVPVIYHLYGRYFEDLVVTTLVNHNDGAVKVRVETQIPGYTEAAVDTVTLGPGETAEVAQNPSLTPQALDLLHSQKDATVHARIDYIREGEPRLVYEGTAPLTIYSRQDFPWNIPGYYNGTLFLAGLVMPNDPALDELMRVAADNIPGGIITSGYGDDDEDGDSAVWNRMKAVYDAVSDYYEVIYVAVGTDFVPKEKEEEGFTLQRLKLPYEVLETRSGMCVELTALFASAFEKMGLRPIIVTVPRHVYVAVPIEWDSDTYYFLEGTLVGRATFEEAVQAGADEFMNDAAPYIEEDRLDDYYWLDVSEARQEEIWPIPWR